MNIIILAVGKKKTPYDEQIFEYQKRIVVPFNLTFEIIDPSGHELREVCRAKESQMLLSKIKSDDAVVALDEFGKNFNTVKFSEFLQKELIDSKKRIVFIIGGAYGFDETIKNRANLILQLSSFTLPHEMVRLIICEQLYRATNYLLGGKYHHA